MVTPAPTPTPVLTIKLTPSPIRLRKNLLDSGSDFGPVHLCHEPIYLRERESLLVHAKEPGAHQVATLYLTWFAHISFPNIYSPDC